MGVWLNQSIQIDSTSSPTVKHATAGRQTMVQDKIGGKFGVPGRKLFMQTLLVAL